MSKKVGSKYLKKFRFMYQNFTDWHTKMFKKNGNTFEKKNRQQAKREIKRQLDE